jgi:GMP synthase-like glutamine amidotransferase
MRVHVLQHVAFEGLGCIEAWLENRHATVTFTRFFESVSLPNLDDVDFIIALGGPMSVNDEDQFPWLADEKRFLAKAIQENKIVLGICLGCQLIASALEAKVYPNRDKEIGWFPVHLQQKTATTLVFPSSMEVFHWHGDTFDLPKGARLLASSIACRNQAFQIGRRVVGLQFHLESTPKSIAAMLENGRHELLTQRFIQTERQIRCVPAISYKIINAFMGKVLEYLMHSYI